MMSLRIAPRTVLAWGARTKQMNGWGTSRYGEVERAAVRTEHVYSSTDDLRHSRNGGQTSQRDTVRNTAGDLAT